MAFLLKCGRRVVVLRAAVLICGVLPAWCAAVDKKTASAPPTASIFNFDVPGGDNLLALSLRAESLPPVTQHDHAILVDTSASQSGAHRQHALAVLEGCLAALPKADRVRLFAFDLKVNPLSDGFHPPQSDETKQAFAKLQRIIPLGATELQPALETALRSFSGNRGRSILYLGDGMSTAKLVQLSELRELLLRMRKERVPINSLAVGPRTDLQLIGTLAVHTGGVVFVDAFIDDTKVTPAQVGQKLALAADAPVFYPEGIKISPEIDQLLPTETPPIRCDRDTILLGKGRVRETLQITVTEKGRTLDWSAKPAAKQSGNTFLVRLWAMAEQTDGLAIAVAGQELLGAARQEFEDYIHQLVTMGRRAVETRDLITAEQIARTILQFDPANVEAETILNAVEKAKNAGKALDRERAKPEKNSKDEKKKVP